MRHPIIPSVCRILLLAFCITASMNRAHAAFRCFPANETVPMKAQAPIVFAVGDWDSSRINGWMAKLLLEERLGIPVQLEEYQDANKVFDDLASGKVHVYLELWLHVDLYKKYVLDDQSVSDVGALGVFGQIGWYVTDYVIAANEDLDNWRALRYQQNIALLHDDGLTANNSTKPTVQSLAQNVTATLQSSECTGDAASGCPSCRARVQANTAFLSNTSNTDNDPATFWGVPSSWDQHDADIIRNLKLNLQHHILWGNATGGGVEADLIDVATRRYRSRLPLIMYFWSPHQIHHAQSGIALTRMQLPSYSLDCQARAATGQYNCDYEIQVLLKLAWPRLEALNPQAMTLAKRFSLRTKDHNEVLANVAYNNMSLAQSACAWLKANPTRWDAWVTSSGVATTSSSSVPLNIILPVVLCGVFVIAVGLIVWTRHSRVLIYKQANQWIIDFKELRIQKVIGEGSFGRVYMAQWRGSVVAVKTIYSTEISLSGSMSSQHGSMSDDVDRISTPAGATAAPALRGANGTAYRTVQGRLSKKGAIDRGQDMRTTSVKSGILSSPEGRRSSRLSRLFLGTSVFDRSLARKNLLAAKEFRAEIATMCKLRHPNIVMFMGACVEEPRLAIVTEYMPKGTLLDLFDNKDVVFDWKLRLSVITDAARGMEYLHSATPPILHLDLKSPNALVDEHNRVKIADFGMATLKESAKNNVEIVGTPQWMAPEMTTEGEVSEKCDVFSFGIIMWEVLARHLPYSKEMMTMTSEQIADAVAKEGLRPWPIPSGCPAYVDLMTACWQQEPSNRPPFSTITERLSSLSPDTLLGPDFVHPDARHTPKAQMEVAAVDAISSGIDPAIVAAFQNLLTKTDDAYPPTHADADISPEFEVL